MRKRDVSHDMTWKRRLGVNSGLLKGLITLHQEQMMSGCFSISCKIIRKGVELQKSMIMRFADCDKISHKKNNHSLLASTLTSLNKLSR